VPDPLAPISATRSANSDALGVLAAGAPDCCLGYSQTVGCWPGTTSSYMAGACAADEGHGGSIAHFGGRLRRFGLVDPIPGTQHVRYVVSILRTKLGVLLPHYSRVSNLFYRRKRVIHKISRSLQACSNNPRFLGLSPNFFHAGF